MQHGDRISDGVGVDAGRSDGGGMDAAPGMDAGGTDAGDPYVDAGDIDAGEMDAGVDAGDIDAGDIDAGDMDAGDMDASDMDAGDMDAGEMDAGDIDAGEMDAGDVDAGPCDGEDCSPLDGPCTVGACDPEMGACVAMPVDEDLECDDGRRCTMLSTCGGGVCLPAIECLTVEAQDVTVTPVRGNPTGGSPFTDICPPSQALVGFTGRLESDPVTGYHGQVGAICGLVEISGDETHVVTVSEGETLPVHGNNGLYTWTRRCPADQVVVGFRGRRGLLIDALWFTCAELSYGPVGDDMGIIVGDTTELPVAGNPTGGGNVIPATSCPENQVATEYRPRSGDSLDAISFGCAELLVPVP